MLKLRPYQSDLINNIRAEIRKGHNRLVMQLPTGGGKTIIFSFMVKQSSERGNRCLILTDRIELLEQAGGTFDKIDISYQNLTAQTRGIPNHRVLVAMVETIKRRAKSRLDFQILLKNIDLIIIDEAHKNTFNEIFQYLRQDCFVIGVTATPLRTGKLNPLSDYFSSLILGPSIESLIQDGYLAKPEYFGVRVDLSSVKLKGGEFDENDMTNVYNDVKVFEGLKHNLDLHAKGLKTMIFCPSVQSSLNVAHELNCSHVDGTMTSMQRNKILTEFENTPGAILSNCGITTVGYDCPSIECIVLYRGTTSLSLYLQMCGRGSRTTDTKKTFKVLDFGMNIPRFGFWHSDRKWTLENDKKKSRDKEDSFPVKFCPTCGAIVAVNVKTCTECGHIWMVTEIERAFAELESLPYNEIQKRINEARTVEEMELIREAKGYKIGYLLHKFNKEEQFIEYAKLKGYNPYWAKIQIKNYLK